RYNNGDQSISGEIDLDNPEGYHGGDIQGIIDRIDEIQENGFTTINLSSIFANASNGFHGYWIEDYYEIEEQFGSIDTLKELVKEAHKRDIRVMLELSTNYVASSHPFVTDGEHDDWFKEANVQQEDATSWLDQVVVLDQSNKEVQEYLLDVATYWINEVNIDGYMLYGVNQMDMDFLDSLTRTLKQKNSQLMLAGKTLDVTDPLDELYELEHLDAIQNEEIMEKLVAAIQEPNNGLDELDDMLLSPQQHKSLLMVDNKEVARFSNLVRDHDRNSVTAWKLALSYLYMMPGTPVIYQGSEIPMYGPGYPENQMLLDSTGAEPDMDDTFSKYASLRDQYQKFVNGEVSIVGRENGMTLYMLSDEEKLIYVAINNDDNSNSIKLEDLNDEMQLRGLLHDDTIRKNKNGVHSIGMERESAEVFMIQPNSGLNWTFIGLVGIVFIIFIVGVLFLTIKQKQRQKTS